MNEVANSTGDFRTTSTFLCTCVTHHNNNLHRVIDIAYVKQLTNMGKKMQFWSAEAWRRENIYGLCLNSVFTVLLLTLVKCIFSSSD